MPLVLASRCSNSGRWTACLSANVMLRAHRTVAVRRAALGGLAGQAAVVQAAALPTTSHADREVRPALASQKASRAFPSG